MSAQSFLQYPLAGDFVHNWLVLGPQATRVESLENFTGSDYKHQIVRVYTCPEHGISETPAEQADAKVGDWQGTWQYFRCRDDHFVDCSIFYHITHYLRAWAYTQVYCPDERTAHLVLTTNGPADVWINGTHCHRQEHFHHQIPHSVPFQAPLKAGYNEILVRFEEVAARECPYAMALKIEGLGEAAPDAKAVRLPTTIENVDKRRKLEQVFEAAFLKQDVYQANETIVIHWPAQMDESAALTARLQTPTGRIYTETNKVGGPQKTAELGFAVQVPDGEYRALLMPRVNEYYGTNLRITKTLPLRAIRGRYSTEPYGTYEERRREALEDAARREGNIFAQIARMALGLWAPAAPEILPGSGRDANLGSIQVEVDVFLKQIESINQRADCSDFYLVGLLGMLYRFGEDPGFPQALRQPLEDCILNFKYWDDEPGSDAMCYRTENHSILFHTCEVLAGQLYPDRVFSNNGQTGEWHRQTGEERALAWLRQRAGFGFLEWDSNTYFEEDILALTHLADLADREEVWELASVVLDKMFFIMALNSYKGTFGSTHGRTYTPYIKGGFFEGTSGVQRIAWGMGVFNDRLLATVSLACSNYELPELLGEIATELPEELWSREHVTAEETAFRASGSKGSGVNKVTYKTPDYMLCSAQDWQPGTPGYQQHIWQATLGPNAAVFVTHPPCASEEGSHRPNFWHGNVILPRAAQWKDVLVSLHHIPEGDWMGFTHAYFPTSAFDEYTLRGGWAFARKGDGYLALWAAQGLVLVEQGDNAYRELRSNGLQNAWLCQMGRAAVDGSFSAFQEKVLAHTPVFSAMELRWQTARGQELRFGWEGPLVLDGEAQDLSNFKHFENLYCTMDLGDPVMEIQKGDQVLRLVFEKESEEA